ncbi:hypothetical protein BE21_05530 [Sorangium cellulosum]|uniref:Uncharacterized protein n=1 Tax=Sorangium cellulosum TaxID=56 RepID=A0A150TCH8_SORCE|nr:hypothetical protein BE21_05530 [Sorangium cellulosum]
MLRSVRVFTNCVDEEQRAQLERALAHFHAAQGVIRIEPCGDTDVPVSVERLNVTRFFAQAAVSDPQIVVTGRRLSDNWFTHAEQRRAVISVADWTIAFVNEQGETPLGAPDANILTSLALTTLLAIAGCNDLDVLHETVGCLFDLCLHKPDRALKMRAAYICSRCATRLAAQGVSSVERDAISAVLDRVRALLLGRRPQATAPQTDDAEDEAFVRDTPPPDGVHLPPRLIEACVTGRLTVLVGSGMSLQKDVAVKYPPKLGWSSLPSWGEVPRRLANAVAYYAGRSVEPRQTVTLEELLADMDFFRRALGETVYYPRAILDLFSPHVISPGRANRLLFKMPVQWVLTTNYDFVLQYAAPPGTPVFTWREARQAREYLAAVSAHRPLLKLHGCASRPDTVVLTGLEYERLRQNEEYLSLLRFVFDSQAILFLGFGLSDPLDLDLAMRQARYAGAAEGEKFALLHRDCSAQVREKFPQVQVITYPDHSSVPAIIAQLVRAARQRQQP